MPDPATPSRRDVVGAVAAAAAALPVPGLRSPARIGPPVATSSPTESPGSNRPRLSVDVRERDQRDKDKEKDKRLPPLPTVSMPTLGSPLRTGKGWALGAYDNKLVSSTLSQLPPLPPLPPLSPGGISSTGSNLSAFSDVRGSPSLASLHPTASFSSIALPRSSPVPMSAGAGSGGVLVLPDGTKLATSDSSSRPDRSLESTPTMLNTMAHSSPNSPWSLLTVHVLPVFAGSPLKTPIEDLNQLANSHLVSTSQRTPTSRLIAVLTNDLREFIGAGMLTLKAKFDALEEAKVVSRTAEVWNFFWGSILPYVEGVFLPFAQVQDVPSSSSSTVLARSAPPIAGNPIRVRELLLSGFLVHILLPLLPRLVPLVGASSAPSRGVASPDLPRLLQMSLVLATQAQYSSVFPIRDPNESIARDEETRESVEELSRAVRWSMAVASGAHSPIASSPTHSVTAPLFTGAARAQSPSPSPHSPTPRSPVPMPQSARSSQAGHHRTPSSTTSNRPRLQRGPSVSQAGRLRRRGTLRGSISQLDPEIAHAQAPMRSAAAAAAATASERWGRPIDEDEEGDLGTPQPARPTASVASTATTATTMRGESLATITERDRRRHVRNVSSGESDLTSVSSAVPVRR